MSPTLSCLRALVTGVSFAGLALAGAAKAQESIPWVGERGITESVAEIMARAELEKPWDPADGLKLVHEFKVDRSGLPQDPDSPAVAMWPVMPGVSPIAEPLDLLPGGKDHGGPALPQTVGVSWNGANLSVSGYLPPDSTGAASASQILVAANGRIRVYSKTGTLGGLNVGLDGFFSSVHNGTGVSDPQVKYDPTSGRFFVVAINLASSNNRVVIAVSDGATITSTSNFTFYFFQQNTVAPTGNNNQFADYPKAGVDANALYIGANMFGGSFSGTTAWVVRKSSITSGGPIVATAFRNLATASGNGPFAPMGADNDDPAATEGYIVGPDNAQFGRIVIRRVSTPGGTPTISGNLNVTVPTTVNPQNQPAMGTTGSLDAIDDRLFHVMVNKDRVSGSTTLWTAHNIEVNASGTASTSGNRNGMRWYEIQNLTGTPSLRQSGTLFDSAGTNPRGYWMGACAMSGQGHMALASSIAGAAERCQIAGAGRFRTDTLGTIQAPDVIQTSSSNYNVQGSGVQRWGDYSQVAVDPSDDMTMWAFQEFCNSTDSWAVRVIKLLAPPPPTPASCSPPNVAQGASNVNVVVTGAPAPGSEYFDPEPSFPNHIAAAVSGTGVTVNSVTWNPATPTQVTMNISVSGGATPGARNVTITNPDGQSAQGTGILTIDSSAVCPTFSQHPSGGTFCQGANVVLSVAASGTPGPTYQWRKDTVNLGGQTGTTLTLNNIQPGDAGSYDCVATNSCGSTTSNAAAVAVNVPPTITSDPSDQGVKAQYFSASFSVTATGSPTLSYQWRKNTVNLVDGGSVSGATTATLTFNPADLGDNGSVIDCVVSNGCGSDTSASATYSVFCPSDFNMDGFVTGDDFDEFVNEFQAGNASADFNNDTFVTGDDFDAYVDAFVAGC